MTLTTGRTPAQPIVDFDPTVNDFFCIAGTIFVSPIINSELIGMLAVADGREAEQLRIVGE